VQSDERKNADGEVDSDSRQNDVSESGQHMEIQGSRHVEEASWSAQDNEELRRQRIGVVLIPSLQEARAVFSEIEAFPGLEQVARATTNPLVLEALQKAIGKRFRATIQRVAVFGVFVTFSPKEVGLEAIFTGAPVPMAGGLVHRSEFSWDPSVMARQPDEMYKEGDEV
jgi:ribosomal protein S1